MEGCPVDYEVMYLPSLLPRSLPCPAASVCIVSCAHRPSGCRAFIDPTAACYMGWQESLVLLGKLVEVDIPDGG